MVSESDPTLMYELNARTFQYKLEELTNTIAYKVQREGHQRGLKPDFVPVDIYYQLRMANQI